MSLENYRVASTISSVPACLPLCNATLLVLSQEAEFISASIESGHGCTVCFKEISRQDFEKLANRVLKIACTLGLSSSHCNWNSDPTVLAAAGLLERSHERELAHAGLPSTRQVSENILDQLSPFVSPIHCSHMNDHR